jgi:hypothetical protein
VIRRFFNSSRRKSFKRVVPTLIALALVSLHCASAADFAVHWLNDASQNVVSALNSSSTFNTSFKSTGDIQITLISGQVNSVFDEDFSSNPGNNAGFLTGFLGNSAQGTGNGIAGHWSTLETTPSGSALSSLQFDFGIPLAAGDKFLIADADRDEQYKIQAFTKNGNGFTPVSLAGWTHLQFSGQTGITPDSQWPTWDPSSGLLTATISGDLFELLDVLVPDQNIDRIVFSKLAGNGSGAIQFESAVPEPGSAALLVFGIMIMVLITIGSAGRLFIPLRAVLPIAE